MTGPASGLAHAVDTAALPPLAEVEALDDPQARVRRFVLTARGAAGREVPIPNSEQLFCTLTESHHVTLNYYPEIDTWVFQIRPGPEAARAAGGLATCLNLSQA